MPWNTLTSARQSWNKATHECYRCGLPGRLLQVWSQGLYFTALHEAPQWQAHEYCSSPWIANWVPCADSREFRSSLRQSVYIVYIGLYRLSTVCNCLSFCTTWRDVYGCALLHQAWNNEQCMVSKSDAHVLAKLVAKRVGDRKPRNQDSLQRLCLANQTQRPQTRCRKVRCRARGWSLSKGWLAHHVSDVSWKCQFFTRRVEDAWRLESVPDQDLDGLITWFGGLGLALRISEPLMDFPLAQSKARFGHPGSWLGWRNPIRGPNGEGMILRFLERFFAHSWSECQLSFFLSFRDFACWTLMSSWSLLLIFSGFKHRTGIESSSNLKWVLESTSMLDVNINVSLLYCMMYACSSRYLKVCLLLWGASAYAMGGSFLDLSPCQQGLLEYLCSLWSFSLISLQILQGPANLWLVPNRSQFSPLVSSSTETVVLLKSLQIVPLTSGQRSSLQSWFLAPCLKMHFPFGHAAMRSCMNTKCIFICGRHLSHRPRFYVLVAFRNFQRTWNASNWELNLF